MNAERAIPHLLAIKYSIQNGTWLDEQRGQAHMHQGEFTFCPLIHVPFDHHGLAISSESEAHARHTPTILDFLIFLKTKQLLAQNLVD